MRIALVKRRYSLKHGGSERYCVNLTRQLTAAGHDVTVIGERIDEELAGEVRFIRVPVNRLTSWTSNRSFAERGRLEVAAGRFDIVYGLGRCLGLDAVRVTERLQSHWLNVYYRHPLVRSLQRFNPRHRTLIDLERTIYRSPDVRRIVTQSELDRRLVVEYYGVPEEKIRTIHNGIDTDLFHPGVRAQRTEVRTELGLPYDVPLMVFASMDFEGKGLRFLLDALRRTRHREARLLVLGSGPVRQFHRIARDFGVEERVIFAGRQSDIRRYYGAGDLFLLPTAYEPFPNVNLEAMACGLPVLTTRTSGGGELIEEGQTGYLITDMPAVGEIVESIDHHFSLSHAEREQMSKRCWDCARMRTLAKNVEQTLGLFHEILLEKSAA